MELRLRRLMRHGQTTNPRVRRGRGRMHSAPDRPTVPLGAGSLQPMPGLALRMQEAAPPRRSVRPQKRGVPLQPGARQVPRTAALRLKYNRIPTPRRRPRTLQHQHHRRRLLRPCLLRTPQLQLQRRRLQRQHQRLNLQHPQRRHPSPSGPLRESRLLRNDALRGPRWSWSGLLRGSRLLRSGLLRGSRWSWSDRW